MFSENLFSDAMRIILVLGALVTMVFMLQRIRVSKVQIKDSIFWIVFSLVLLIISIFPRIAFWVSDLLGFQSPINVVYLLIIFVLLVKLFSTSVRISQLDTKLQQLTQRVALDEKDKEEAALPKDET